MAEQRAQRRLAAILAADVVGYSRLMEQDEAGTLAMLKQRHKAVMKPMIARHHGRIVKLMGDGILVDFGSAVDAVACAAELQEAMGAANADLPEDRHIVWRVGVNLGDVIVEGSDLFGDGVNIAARLQAIAEPGRVFISQTVFGHVRGKVQLAFDDLGEQSLKNMAEPVRVYRVSGTIDSASRPTSGKPAPVSKLSIAVLPFVNLSGEPEQEYFSDGITEDIITDLSKVATLNVLSRNTTFTFKGKAVDVSQIARQLKVGHVVEGSVRKSGGRVRITAQLIDAARDTHLWAERYDRDLVDIFALQDEISWAIVAALKIKLLPEEVKAIESRSTENPNAYQLYLLARFYKGQPMARTQEIALRYCQRALDIDPNYARAWALAGLCQASLHQRGRLAESGLAAAEKALSLDPTLADAHATKGRSLAEIGRFDEALVAHEESLRLDPDSFDVHANFGSTCMWLGRKEAAVVHFERAAQLSETNYINLSLAASCYRALGRVAECKAASARAIERMERDIAIRPDNAHALAHGSSDLIHLGEFERAKEWISRALMIEPDDLTNHYNLACSLAQLNETEQALDLLEGYVEKMPASRIGWIKRDPDLVLLHDHPRYQALVARGEARLAAVQPEQAS
jgi:adenylate cyclase